ncbi:MAG: Methyltransferase type 11 [Ramlibacter sp.]|nr:Methyltransferase type 11 [Ramlibacter sp.]
MTRPCQSAAERKQSKDEPAKLAALRAELDAFIARHFENNLVRQQYLMTRATKK